MLAETHSIWEEATHVLTDPGHVLAEVIWSCGEFLLGIMAGRFFLNRHDRNVHHVDRKIDKLKALSKRSIKRHHHRGEERHIPSVSRYSHRRGKDSSLR